MMTPERIGAEAPKVMTVALPNSSPRFVRRTLLAADEYHKNFHKLDAEAVAAVTSAEADRVTPLMSKIYLQLVSAPSEFWEREGVLYFATGEKDGQPVKASKVLYECLGVASATAHKALRWMHEEGIIGYFAGRNGAGIRIFLNRAAGSIGVRATPAGKKILPFARGSNDAARGSTLEPPFNDSFADPEVLDIDSDPRAPTSGAESTEVVKKHFDPRPAPTQPVVHLTANAPPSSAPRFEVPVEEIVSRLRQELEPSLQSAARQAATREHERTREWLESRGLPKAARVAQREAYDVLRRYGVISEPARGARAHADVGRGDYARPEPHQLSPDEVAELAEACVAMLEAKGQAIEVTLSEMSAEAGGFLLAGDTPRVREKAKSLLCYDDGAGK